MHVASTIFSAAVVMHNHRSVLRSTLGPPQDDIPCRYKMTHLQFWRLAPGVLGFMMYADGVMSCDEMETSISARSR